MRIEPRPKKEQDPLSRSTDGGNFIVNPAFRGNVFAANKKLDEGDLSINSKYAKSFLAVTDKLIYGFDDAFEGGVKIHSYDKVKRAFVKRYYGNAMLVFSMDEATASVDSETEALIQDAIDSLISGRTTLMIAHRLSTLRKANKIIVVDKGEILEMGTPEELLAAKGKYYKLVQIQTMSDEIRKTKEEERFD